MNREEVYNRYYGYYNSMFESTRYVEVSKLCGKIITLCSWDNLKEEECKGYLNTIFSAVFNAKERASYNIYKLYLYAFHLDENKLSTDDFVRTMTIAIRSENIQKLYRYAYTQKSELVIECYIKLLFAVACIDQPIEVIVNKIIYLFIDEYLKVYKNR